MRILVIEDETDIREALHMALTDDGYVVDTASEGEEGLYKAKEWDYDAILLDLMMPKKDGWEVLEALRKHKRTPVIILTARGDIEDRVKGLDLGSDDFVVKPFEMEEVSARLRAVIRRSAGLTTSKWCYKNLEVDHSTKVVRVSGKVIPLTMVEYNLLAYLLMHQGQVISRENLYDHLFDENDDSMSNTLEVHVCNTRKKLKEPFIHTRRGLGYQLGEP